VLASNGEEQVKRVADRFQFDLQTVIQVHSMNGRKPIAPVDDPISVNDLLANYIELQDVATRGQIGRMAEYTHDAAEKQRLEKLSGTDDESTVAYRVEALDRRKSVIDLLEECPSCALPFNIYLEFLTPLRPRYYSISSSPLVNAEECSITVGVVKGAARSGHGVFQGMCSNYLSHQKKGSMIYAFVQNTNTLFHLPEDMRTPLIMIGPGTGIAPFRGFLQERAMQQKGGKQLGKALLFFGCRHPERDYIYQQELEEFVQAGVTELYTAFSRLDPHQKVYVQDGILEHKDKVWQMVQDGAIVYICGDTSHMVPDVEKTFIRICQEKTSRDESAAKAWLADLKEQNRYLVDIWGI
jgi:cytochrome P450/NADPH-cytochrome P450 reductase